MVTLDVYVPTKHVDDPDHPDLANVTSIFGNITPGYFDVSLVLFNPVHIANQDNDFTMVREALVASHADYIMICKPTSVSISTSDDLLNMLEQSVSTSFDILWLAKWLDRCDLYSNYVNIGTTGVYLVDTQSPHGIQCLLFSTEGKEKFLQLDPLKKDTPLSLYLNRQSSSSFHSVTITPSPVKFDIRKVDDDIDYVKLTECVNPPGSIKPDRAGNDIGFFIFIVIGLLLIGLIYVIIKFGNQATNKICAYAARKH
jgi:tetrahydromethanopterin S-methyltransferase subunit G